MKPERQSDRDATGDAMKYVSGYYKHPENDIEPVFFYFSRFFDFLRFLAKNAYFARHFKGN
jgi:hypothetical protein